MTRKRDGGRATPPPRVSLTLFFPPSAPEELPPSHGGRNPGSAWSIGRKLSAVGGEESARGRSGGGTGASLVQRRRERRLLQGAAPWLCLRFLLRSEAAIAAMGGSRDDEYDYLFKGGLRSATPARPVWGESLTGASSRTDRLLGGAAAPLRPAWVTVGDGGEGRTRVSGEPSPLGPALSFSSGGSPRGGGIRSGPS